MKNFHIKHNLEAFPAIKNIYTALSSAEDVSLPRNQESIYAFIGNSIRSSTSYPCVDMIPKYLLRFQNKEGKKNGRATGRECYQISIELWGLI